MVDGTSLFLGIGTLFVAQLYGIDLSFGDQALFPLGFGIVRKPRLATTRSFGVHPEVTPTRRLH